MVRLRRPFVIIHRIIVAAAIVTILSSLTLIIFLVFWQDIAEEWTTGRRPTTYNGTLQADLLDDYGLVFSSGHNSGGTLAATRQALRNGADVIEVDVASMGDVLVSAHLPPLPLVGHRVFRGPTLEEVWQASSAADIIKLDLKESSPEFRELLFEFLNEHQDERQVIVSTRHAATLTLLMSRSPSIFRFLSIGDEDQLDRLYRNTQLLATIDGVNIRHTLLNAHSAARLDALGIIVVAWTVNDLNRVNELVRLGVDGITTDNLAIMRLLGGEQRGERRLREYRLATEAWQQQPDRDAAQSGQQHRPGQPHIGAPEQDPHFHRHIVLRDEGGNQRQQHSGNDQPQRPASRSTGWWRLSHRPLPSVASLPILRQD